MIAKTYGPWSWVYLSYSYLLIITACIIHIRAILRKQRLYQWQTWALLTGMVLPLLANLSFILKIFPLKFDLAPTIFAVGAFFYMIGLFRFRLFDILPAGRDLVIESMGDVMLIWDKLDRLVDFNPAATQVLAITNSMLGRTTGEVFTHCPGLRELALLTENVRREVMIGGPEKKRYYIARWWPIIRQKQFNGRLLMLQDITAAKEAQQEALRQQQFAAILEIGP